MSELWTGSIRARKKVGRSGAFRESWLLRNEKAFHSQDQPQSLPDQGGEWGSKHALQAASGAPITPRLAERYSRSTYCREMPCHNLFVNIKMYVSR